MVPDMANSFEAGLVKAMDAAAEEAVSEYAEFDESVDESESVDVDEGDVGDVAEESAEMQDDEGLDEADEVADDPEEAAAPFEWDGNPNTVPAEWKPVYDQLYGTMRKGVDMWMGKKAQEWGEQKAQLEARVQELESQRQAELIQSKAPKMPEQPGDDASRKEWDEYYDQRTSYIAWKQLEEARQAGIIPDPSVVHQMAARQAAIGRASMIESRPGYTDEIGQAMVEMAQSNPYWNSALQTDEGAIALFDLVKTQKESVAFKEAAAKANKAELQRKASAGQRKVSKPQSSPRPATPARNFADMGFEDRLDASIEDALKEFK